MMRNATRGFLLTLALLSGSSLAGDSTPALPALKPPPGLGIPENYRDWKPASRLAISGLHWQQWVIVYTNHADVYHNNQDTMLAQRDADGWTASADDKQKAEARQFGKYPAGTLLVKESYVGDNGLNLTPIFLAIMIKRAPGFDPRYGDWEYIQSNPAGEVLLRGPMSSQQVQAVCGACHRNVPERDYVFATTGLGSK